MTTSIARQSVIIKCNMQRAFLLGNYEYYYAAGLASKLFGFEVAGDAADSHQRKKHIQCQIGELLDPGCIDYLAPGEKSSDAECNKCLENCQKCLIRDVHFL